MMAHLTLSALARSIAWVCLAAPLAYYAGGAALHWRSVQEASALAAQLESANAKQSLLVDQPFTYRSANFETLKSSGNVSSFAAAFADAGRGRGGPEYVQYYHAKDAECALANRGYFFEKRFEPFAFRPDLFFYVHPKSTRQCLLQRTVAEKPDPTYEVRSWLDRDLPDTLLLRPYVIAWKASNLRTGATATVRVGRDQNAALGADDTRRLRIGLG